MNPSLKITKYARGQVIMIRITEKQQQQHLFRTLGPLDSEI